MEKVIHRGQHPYRHKSSEVKYTNVVDPAIVNVQQALDLALSGSLFQWQVPVANKAALPLTGNLVNDARIVEDDGDGKPAAYVCIAIVGNVDAQWSKLADVDWGEPTLDIAYDGGGSGVGRVITADSGAVEINSTGGAGALILDGTNPEIFLVRKVGDTGDVFRVDSTNAEVEFVGSKLRLDADGNTYIDPSVDNIIDIYINNSNDFSFSANTFTVKGTNNIFWSDGATVSFGGSAGSPDAKLFWSVSDANANLLLLTLPEGGPTDVPGFVIGDRTADGLDLGLFDGITGPFVATLSSDALKATYINHNGSVGRLVTTTGDLLLQPASNVVSIQDDNSYALGTADDAKISWSTSDANANLLLVTLPEGGVTDVPGFVVGDRTADSLDLGLFDGLTSPFIAALSDDALSSLYFYHDGSNGQIRTTEGSINFTTPGGVLIDNGPLAVGASAVVGSALTLGQAVATSGSPIGLSFTAGAHTTLTASTEATDVFFDLGRTVEFDTGALTLQRAVNITQPTFGFVGSSTLSTGVTFEIEGPPEEGTNANITNAYAFAVGRAMATTKANIATSIFVTPVGITNGEGNRGTRSAVHINDPSNVSLGNTFSTLNDLGSIILSPITYESTTNVRTVTDAASLLILGIPTDGGNITFTNGPYSIWDKTGPARFDGMILKGQGGDIASANDITHPQDANYNDVTGTTTINRIATAGFVAGTSFRCQFDGALTIADAVAAGGGFGTILTDSSVDIITAAGTIVEFQYDGTSFKAWIVFAE